MKDPMKSGDAILKNVPGVGWGGSCWGGWSGSYKGWDGSLWGGVIPYVVAFNFYKVE